jgi:hypothetical protein
MDWVRGVVAVLAIGVAAAACSGEDGLGGKPPRGTGGAGSATGTGGSGGTGGVCASFQVLAPGPDAPRDVLVVLDRSATMADDVNGTSCPGGCGASSKWSLLTAAVEDLISSNPQVNWGLALYGGDDLCSVASGVAVEVGAYRLNAIETAIAAASPAGSSGGAGPAIYNAWNYLNALPDLVPHYIMLVTDGQAVCASNPDFGNADLDDALNSAFFAGYPTFVVGPPGGSDTTSVAALNAQATLGGLPNTGVTSYYAPSDLGAVIDQIGQGQGTLCTIPLSTYIDGYGNAIQSVTVTRPDGTVVAVPQDAAAGWSIPPFYYADSQPKMIVLNGELCQEWKAGDLATVTITYNCSVY